MRTLVGKIWSLDLLWARKLLKKERIVGNCILHFKSGFICQHKKLFWRLSLRNLFQDSVSLLFTGPGQMQEPFSRYFPPY